MLNPKNAPLVNVLLEGLIPVLGYFLFGWSLFEILLFYILDVLSEEYGFAIRTWYAIRKPKYYKGWDPSFRKTFLKYFTLSFLTFIASLSLFYWALTVFNAAFHTDGKSLYSAVQTFFISNFFLIPLLVLAKHMQAYMSFIKPGLYVTTTAQKVFNFHLTNRFFLIIGLVLLTFMPYFFNDRMVILICLVLIKAIFDIFSHRYLKEKAYAKTSQ